MKHKSNDSRIWISKRTVLFKNRPVSRRKVEDQFELKFSGAHAVLVSSGRAAIAIVIKQFFKGDIFKIFPYASQCVVTSVQKAGKFPCSPLDLRELDISYNQWGRVNRGLIRPPLIQDSVDSFYPINSGVLMNGGMFEIWSLSKILGIDFGAIIWCKNKNDADQIREILIKSKSTFSVQRYLLRLFKNTSAGAYRKWEEIEYEHPQLSRLENGVIYNNLMQWETIYERRKNLFKTSCQFLGINNPLLEQYEVIPAVIDVSKLKIEFKKTPIKELHRWSSQSGIVKTKVFAYQVERG